MSDYRSIAAIRRALGALALCFLAGCSSKAPLAAPPEVQVVFQPFQGPSSELCRDDTHNGTDYINVPLVRFVGSKIELNGAQSSEAELLDWAQKKYKNMAEQALWVQVAPDDKPRAEHALLPLVKSLPQLQLRQVDPSFTCSKQRRDR
jgi:hypothetical protein